MLVDLSIMPLGSDPHISGPIAEAVRVVEQSGLPYRLTAAGTRLEGEWDEVMAVVKRCHERVREMSPHLVTLIKGKDDEGAHDKLRRIVTSVQEKGGSGAPR